MSFKDAVKNIFFCKATTEFLVMVMEMKLCAEITYFFCDRNEFFAEQFISFYLIFSGSGHSTDADISAAKHYVVGNDFFNIPFDKLYRRNMCKHTPKIIF